MLTVTPVGGGKAITVRDVTGTVRKGQWGILTNSSGELVFDPVDADADTQLDRERYYIIDKEILHKDKGDADYDQIVPSSNSEWDGNWPKVWKASDHHIIECDVTDGQSQGDFANANPGDLLYLNASGWLTTSGATDFVTGSTPVAVFHSFVNGILTYETL